MKTENKGTYKDWAEVTNGNNTENKEDNPTEKILNEVEVVGTTVVEETKKRGVTAKTIGAFSTQLEKMIEDKLLDTEEGKQMKELLTKAKTRWIEKMLK